MKTMIQSNKKGVQYIVAALADLGLQEVVICPGSRNAPLVVSFNRHPQFNCSSIRDERSAGFFALGKAIETQKPVAIVSTSGSAALNFAPAVVEAYYQRVPLIIITADRLKEWTDQGDGQTINQTNVYKNYIRGSFELKGDAKTDSELWQITRSVSEAWTLATQSNRGSVHLNVPLNEPLYDTEEVKNLNVRTFIQKPLQYQLSEEDKEELAAAYNSSSKVMILVGQHRLDPDFEKVLQAYAAFDNCIILTESTANIHHPVFITHIDRCITQLDEAQAKALMPDILITVGDAIISKRIKTLVRKNRPTQHWHIHPYDSMMDTYQSLTTALPMSAHAFLEQLLPLLKIGASNYKQQWLQVKTQKEERHQAFCKDIAFSDFGVFKKVFESIPQNFYLHISNSSPIRYAQLFDYNHIAYTHCNRGTSGIEGCSSTAMGAASAHPEKDFLLITGDVAFHYDSNALWNENEVQNLNILLINNSGGGIFRIISGPDTVSENTVFLETRMQQSAEHLAAQYKWNYLSAKDEGELKLSLADFFKQKRTILEVFTDADTNPKVLSAYWEFLNQK